MGFSEWRAARHMKNPVRGVFRVTGFYDRRSSTIITGVITAPGIPATPAEHKTDKRGRWAGNNELPVAVDQANPSQFAILWDEVDAVSWQSQEMQAAQRLAEQLNAGPGTSFGTPDSESDGLGFGGPGFSYTTTVTIGPDGKPMSAEAAAQISEVVKEALSGVSAAFEGTRSSFGDARTAERGTAIVLDAREAPNPPGVPLPPGGRADLLLELNRADGAVYQTHTVIAFSTPGRRAAIATPGTHLNVWIDPRAASRVTVDLAGCSRPRARVPRSENREPAKSVSGRENSCW